MVTRAHKSRNARAGSYDFLYLLSAPGDNYITKCDRYDKVRQHCIVHCLLQSAINEKVDKSEGNVCLIAECDFNDFCVKLKANCL